MNDEQRKLILWCVNRLDLLHEQVSELRNAIDALRAQRSFPPVKGRQIRALTDEIQLSKWRLEFDEWLKKQDELP